jgi:hypothetical protein
MGLSQSMVTAELSGGLASGQGPACGGASNHAGAGRAPVCRNKSAALQRNPSPGPRRLPSAPAGCIAATGEASSGDSPIWLRLLRIRVWNPEDISRRARLVRSWSNFIVKTTCDFSCGSKPSITAVNFECEH